MKPFTPILAVLICLLSPALAQEEASADPKARPVKLMTLEAGGGTLEREFFGRIRARQTVDLAFQVGGQILRFPVEEGERLSEGDLIAELDLTTFQREVERSALDLAKADRDLERLRELRGGAVTEVQVRDAETTADLARITRDEAQDRLEDATLASRFDALVARREVPNFTTVSQGQAVVRLHDMSELRVDIDVPEVLFRSAAAASEVNFNATFPGSPESFPLVLREFEAETAEIAQTYSITLAFTGDIPAWILPGASVTVSAEAARTESAGILLPETALVFDSNRVPGLMVFSPDGTGDAGTVTWQQVEIEMRDDGRVALVAGPDPGTEIVMAGASQLRDGQAVRRFAGMGE